MELLKINNVPERLNLLKEREAQEKKRLEAERKAKQEQEEKERAERERIEKIKLEEEKARINKLNQERQIELAPHKEEALKQINSVKIDSSDFVFNPEVKKVMDSFIYKIKTYQKGAISIIENL